MRRLWAWVVVWLVLGSPVFGETIAGRASVIDGDTIEIGGKRIRLHGIDAPEASQLCEGADGALYRCGQRAAFSLADRIGSATVSCDSRDRDRYGRIVAVCRRAGEDLSAWMTAQGWALAYRSFARDYVTEEETARRARLGLWSGTFDAPWEWRRNRRIAGTPRSDAPTAATGATGRSPRCAIKGNINSNGDRIYHVPGSSRYAGTRINARKGERWFCSEREAREAGWRAPR